MFKIILILTFLLLGCESTQLTLAPTKISDPQVLYADDDFAGFSDIIIPTQQDVFAIDSAMKRMVNLRVKKHRDIHLRSSSLLKALFSANGQGISYDINANTPAIETFHSGRANCLSLTILAYSLAKEANINIKFQDVEVPEYWLSNGEYSLLAGHVNLVVTSNELTDFGDGWGREVLEIDFDPDSIKKSFPRKSIHIKTVLAMYYNNIAAQAIVNQQYVKAYALLKSATLVDPSLASAWVNLGVLYKHTQHIALAEQTYRYAIEIAPHNGSALTNLSSILREQGVSQELRLIEEYLQGKRSRNPYYYAMLGAQSFNSGDIENAVKHYKHAIRLNAGIHEFYYGLAKVYTADRNYNKAKSLMIQALKLNEGIEIEGHYQNKLNFLTQASLGNSH